MPETAEIRHRLSPVLTIYRMRPSAPGVGVGNAVSWAGGAANVLGLRNETRMTVTRKKSIPVAIIFLI
jgi:hypothetical protein